MGNDGRPTNKRFHLPVVYHIIDTVAQVANVAAEGCIATSLDDPSTSSSWPMDAVSRPSRDSIVRLVRDGFYSLRAAPGPFNVDLMACSASAWRSPPPAPTCRFLAL